MSSPVRIESLESRTLLAAELLADINPVSDGSSNAYSVLLNDTLYFGWGSDLWTSDGTSAGTARVKTTSPAQAGWFEPLQAFPQAGVVMFTAVTEPGVAAVFRSDGTPQGTFQLAVSRPAADRFYVAGRHAFWFSDDELWVTDGTAEGTAKIAGGLAPAAAAASDDGLFFLTRDAGRMWLWKSDGTAAGTSAVADVWLSNPETPKLVATNGRAYFQLATGTLDGYTVYTLFTSDGTAAGTKSVRTLGRSAGGLVGMGGKAFFRNADPSLPGYEPWVSDGTPGGTTRLKDVIPGTTGSNPTNFAVVADTLYFTAAGNASNPQVLNQIWKSDGTTAGTVVVKNMSGVGGFVGAAGKVYFRAGNSVWATDGTAAGTTEVPLPGITTGQFDFYHVLSDGRIAFHGADPVHGAEWRFTDGTAAGTTVLDLTPQTHDSVAGGFGELGGKVYAEAWTGAVPGQPDRLTLVRIDAATGGTEVVRDNLPFGGPLVRSGDRLYFTTVGAFGLAAQSLWTTDGTAAGTVLIQGLVVYNTMKAPLTDVGGTLFFLGRTNSFGPFSLWRSDGTEAGTYQVSPLPIDDAVQTQRLFAVGRTVYFVASSPETGVELYRAGADGGPATLVKDVRPGATDSDPVPQAVLNGRLYFTARDDDADRYRHLWSTDGTPGGTYRVSDVQTNPDFGGDWSDPCAVAWNGSVYFAGGFGTPDAGLWKTEGSPAGTPAGTSRVYRGRVDSVYAAGSHVFFTAASDDYTSDEVGLLASDGTAAGTVPLHRFSGIVRPTAFADRLFFAGTEPAYGTELWSSDGTPAGTRIEADLIPGAASGVDPFDPGITVAANMLVFTGKTPQHGIEPRKWVPGGALPPAQVIGRQVFYNNSAADGFNGSANAADDNAIARDKVAALPGRGSDFQSRTSFSGGLNGIMVDVATLPAGTSLSADDFEVRAGTTGDPFGWPLAAAPQVTVRRGAGAYSADRVSLTWKNGAAPKNTWVRVTVKATPRTGLTSADVFFFGNLVGDAIDTSADDPFAVDRQDLQWTRSALGSTDPSNAFDFNRDGRVNVFDLAIVRANLGRGLSSLPTSVSSRPAQLAAAAPPSAAIRSTLRVRRTWYEPAAQ